MLKYPWRLTLLFLAIAWGLWAAMVAQRYSTSPARPCQDKSPAVVTPGPAPLPRVTASVPTTVSPAPWPIAEIPEAPPTTSPASPAIVSPYTMPDIAMPDAGALTPAQVTSAAPLPLDVDKLVPEHPFAEFTRPGESQTLAFLTKKSASESPVGGNNAAGIGPQYSLLKNDDTTVLGRVAGRYKLISPGLNDQQRMSEVLLGCEVEHRVNRRNKVVSGVEYSRDVADLNSRHVRTRAAWEVLLDTDENISLRTGVLESSTYVPNREQAAKNLNYTLDVIWKF
jgi:hypothetical protein